MLTEELLTTLIMNPLHLEVSLTRNPKPLNPNSALQFLSSRRAGAKAPALTQTTPNLLASAMIGELPIIFLDM